ncbi:hypothetical protein LINPERHAP1_LOCUS29956 [Linum perenne]
MPTIWNAAGRESRQEYIVGAGSKNEGRRRFLIGGVLLLRSGGSSAAIAVGRRRGKGKEGGNDKSKSFWSGVQAAEKNKLFFFGGGGYRFDLEDLLRASAEVLGKGSFGTTRLDAEVDQMVVKNSSTTSILVFAM